MFTNVPKTTCIAFYYIILNDIRNYATLAVNEREHLADKLCKTLKKSNRSDMGSVKTKIKSIETRLLELNDRIKCIYEDKCTGRILHLDL